MTTTAEDTPASVVILSTGERGDTGDSGVNGSGLNDVRYNKLTSPLVHLFKTNKLVDTLSGSLSFTRSTTATYIDRYGVLQSSGIDTPREEKEGWLIEGDSTNECLWSRDLTNAVWIKTNITAAKDADGLDGTTNGASSLTATAANGTCFQTLVLPSSENTYSVDVKRRTGVGTVEITDDGGATYADITSLINASTYTRISVTTTQANPSVGFRISVTSDSIDVDYNQLESLPFYSSRIPTTTAAVTRSADVITSTINENFPTKSKGAFTVFCNAALLHEPGELSGNAYLWGTYRDGSNYITSSFSASNFLQATSVDDTVSSQASKESANSRGVSQSLVSVFNSSGDIDVYIDSVIGVSATQNEDKWADLAAYDALSFGGYDSGTTLKLFGHISDFRIYDFALTSDEVKFLS